jgi:ribonuclease I
MKSLSHQLPLFFSVLASSAVHVSTAFDYYVFAQTWVPQFCKLKNNSGGCTDPTDFMQSHVTVHGLWPSTNRSANPSFCSKEPLRARTIQAIGKATLDQFWPDVQTNYGHRLIAYEWAKHGTCSGLKQLQYLRSTIYLAQTLGTPAVISNNVGWSASTQAIRQAYVGPEKAILFCSAGGFLIEVRTCHDKTTLSQIPCPPELRRHDNCRYHTARVRKFGQHRTYPKIRPTLDPQLFVEGPVEEGHFRDTETGQTVAEMRVERGKRGVEKSFFTE